MRGDLRLYDTVWVLLHGRNYSEDAYFANDLNREYCAYGQA
jgi:hypothetical protein